MSVLSEITELAHGTPTPLAWARLGWLVAGATVEPTQLGSALAPLSRWPRELRGVEEWIDIDESSWGWWQAGLVEREAPWLRHVAWLALSPRTLLGASAGSAWRTEALHPRLTLRLGNETRQSRFDPVATREAVACLPVHTLAFCGRRPSPKGATRLEEFFARLPAVRGLLIEKDAVPERALRDVASAAESLVSLRLRGTRGRTLLAEIVEGWPSGAPLRVLDVSGGDLSPEDLMRVVDAPVLADLEALAVGGQGGRVKRRDRFWRRVAERGFDTLVALDAEDLLPWGQGSAVSEALDSLPALRWLRLGATYAGDECFRDIAAGASFGRLRWLDISQSDAGSAFARAAVARPDADLRWLGVAGAERLTLDDLSALQRWLERRSGVLETGFPEFDRDEFGAALDHAGDVPRAPVVAPGKREVDREQHARDHVAWQIGGRAKRKATGIPGAAASKRLKKLLDAGPSERAWRALGALLVRLPTSED